MNPPTAQLCRITSGQLADWLEAQGPDLWWMVDGDWLLGGMIAMPTTADRLAAKIRAIPRSLIVLDPFHLHPNPADPMAIDLNRIADVDNPRGERIFYLRWDDELYSKEWELSEDKESAEFARALGDHEES